MTRAEREFEQIATFIKERRNGAIGFLKKGAIVQAVPAQLGGIIEKNPGWANFAYTVSDGKMVGFSADDRPCRFGRRVGIIFGQRYRKRKKAWE